MDNYASTNTCQPTASSTNGSPPCAPLLVSFVKSTFGKVYLAVFAALAVELLALSNAITLICSGSSSDYDEEGERRKRRKSGIRLDDMSVDTPTTVGSYHQEEQKDYYAGGNNNAYNTHDEPPSRNNRYDSYDMYRHNNNSNNYSDNYNSNTINNNRHGNGNAYY
jgi:hypothetical protein